MKMMKQVLTIVAVLGFAIATQAGVTLDVVVGVNSLGQDIYTITATSDGAPITSLGIDVVGAGNLGQVHPMAFESHLGDYNPFMAPPTAVDQDTQAMFSTAADNLLVVAGTIDSADQLNVNFTGFAAFQTRAVAQVVLTGGEAIATIGAVSDGVEYTTIAVKQGTNSALVPEPASLSFLAIGGLLAIRRR